MSLLQYYQDQISKGSIVEDKQQLTVLSQLQEISAQLSEEQKKRYSLLGRFRKNHLVKGLYLWGGVGIGKTFIMDCFFNSLPFNQKLRVHFHQFMKTVHTELKQLQGKKNPLQVLAKHFAERNLIICFDEFFVSDIADAMILAGLFKALFAEGVSLVATSNIPPDELYKYGLQRSLFLPAIELIKKNTSVVHIESLTDYRLRHLIHAGVFYHPLNESAHQEMEKSFELLRESHSIETQPILICNRLIPIVKQAGGIVWFEFADICHVPRSQLDYLEISKKYHTVFISNIPYFKANDRNTINLFIRLIDVLYDAKIRLVCSATDIAENLYKEGPLQFEYMRTCSRLTEMQSENYFKNPAYFLIT